MDFIEVCCRREDSQLASYKWGHRVICNSCARIHLYAYLDKLQERAIYTDTDSIIYIQDDAEPPLIDCGDKLGSMTNALHPGEFIEVCQRRAKKYAYRVVGGWTDTTKTHKKTVCKVRGITLNYSTSQLVNFDVIRDMILKTGRSTPGDDVVTVHTDKKNKRKRGKDGRVQILSEVEDKIYRVSFFKRRRLHDNNSVPFGYINNEWWKVAYISHVRVAQVQAPFYLYNSGS